MSTISERLQDIFKSLGLTASQFASKYDLNRQTIYSIANGRNEPSLKLLMQICSSEPKISLEYLLMGKGSPLVEDEIKESYQKTTVESLLMEVEFLRRENSMFKDQIEILTDQNRKLINYITSTKDGSPSFK